METRKKMYVDVNEVCEDWGCSRSKAYAIIKQLSEQMREGRNGLLQSKYFVITCIKPDFESARNYFNTIEYSIQQAFHRLGSGLIPLNATERLRALHSFYRMGEEKLFDFEWDRYLALRRDWRNDIINTSLKEEKDYLEMDGNKYACALFVRNIGNSVSDQFMHELTNLNFPMMYTMDVEPMDVHYAYQMIMKKYMANERRAVIELYKKKLTSEPRDISVEEYMETADRDGRDLLDRLAEKGYQEEMHIEQLNELKDRVKNPEYFIVSMNMDSLLIEEKMDEYIMRMPKGETGAALDHAYIVKKADAILLDKGKTLITTVKKSDKISQYHMDSNGDVVVDYPLVMTGEAFCKAFEKVDADRVKEIAKLNADNVWIFRLDSAYFSENQST